MEFKVVIPARYASTRLPGKPLLEIGGKPMIRHVYERAAESGAGEVIIATDDERIREVAEGFGAKVCMTSPRHSSGTERLAEVVERLRWSDEEIVVNLQGDEPAMPPVLLQQVAKDLADEPRADLATLSTPIHAASELFDPHVVKVVTDREGFALYFSRAAIPWDRDAFAISIDDLACTGLHFRHLGLYAYRAGYIRRYVTLAPCALEKTESLEQLRVLWYGGRIHVVEARVVPGPGIDTPADLERIRLLYSPQSGNY